MSNQKTVSDLATSLLCTIEPFMAKLDENHHEGVAGKDTGSSAPSKTHIGLRILLDSLCNQPYRQIYGNIVSSTTNQRINNLQDRVHEADQRLTGQLNRYRGEDGMPDMDMAFTDPRTFELMYQLELAQLQYDVNQEIYDAFRDVYNVVTGEQWTPRDVTTTNSKITNDAKEAMKAKLLERLAKKVTPTTEAPLSDAA